MTAEPPRGFAVTERMLTLKEKRITIPLGLYVRLMAFVLAASAPNKEDTASELAIELEENLNGRA